jgi:hypothetical protein
MPPTTTSLLRTLGLLLLSVVVGLAGAALGMAAWGATSVDMGPFRVRLAGGFGHGVTEVGLPPFGRLTADTHTAPLHMTATLEDLNVPELAGALRRRSVDAIVAEVEHDAEGSITPFALRLLGIAVAGATLLAVPAFWRRWRRVAIASLAALLVVGGSEVAAWGTYRPNAFLSPTYSGSLRLARHLIGPVQTASSRIEDFRSELARIVTGGGDPVVRAGLPTAADRLRRDPAVTGFGEPHGDTPPRR